MSDRWPMTRGELATRLSKALEDVKIAVRDPENSGSVQGSPDGWKHLWSMGVAFYPSDTAERLVDAIDAQGTEDDAERRRRTAEINECRVSGARCDREGGPCTCPCPPEDGGGTPGTADGPPLPMPADAPYPLVTEYPDLAAAATIIRELNALSGTSGAGWDHMVNVLRFTAGHFGYELHEQDT